MTTNLTLVFDASPLNHFARANELDTLRLLVADYTCVTTRAVRGELTLGAERFPEIAAALAADWIEVVSCDELRELVLFTKYINRLGNITRNMGEATVLAWAEAHSGIAYLDDREACRAGRSAGVTVHRTLQLIVAAFRATQLTESEAQQLVCSLASAEARFPQAAKDDLFGWARTRNPPLL
jgi:predicted nucleic acid-binding protein